MWESPGVLMPRAPRVLAAGLLLALALPSLAACRTSPDVAAYVGDAQVTVTELERALDERLADAGIAEFAASDRSGYTRRVLGFLVQREIYDAMVERYDVSVADAAVRARIDELMGDRDPDDQYAELAGQGVSRADVTETIRQQLLLEQVGGGDVLGEEALRARYAEVRDGLTQVEFGVVTVPDEATADAVLAELTADPAGYPAVAARYPGSSTLPELVRGDPREIVPVLGGRIEATPAGTGFVQPLAAAGGVVVAFTAGELVPTFEEARPELEVEARAEAQQAGAARVDEVREDLDVTVNPRYGVLDEDGRLVRDEGGVVEILSGRPEVRPAGPGD